MQPFDSDTREEVWLKAVSHLIKQDDMEDFNVILEVRNPIGYSERSTLIETKVNALLLQAGQQPLHTVAETIFPYMEYLNHGTAGVFEKYPNEIYPLIKQDIQNNKGTYAMRLLGPIAYRKGETIIPLQYMIKKMKGELGKSNTKKSVYEISVDEIGSVPIQRNENDIKMYMGFPCLSHLSFKLCPKTSTVNLTALYRAHHYFSRALGNLLGLARLQYFVAQELGIQPGTLVCHSTFAKLDTHTGVGISKLRKFLQEMKSV